MTAERARFDQLVYTSLDRGDGGRGGWQVKEATATLTEEERRTLVAGVATGLVDERGQPGLPTAAEIEARPRRLVYAPGPVAAGEPTAAYWHTTSAGKDASGRPGNVFAHVLLDRAPAAPVPPLRPSDLLLAPQWLRPFGTQAVLDASLADVPAPPWAEPVLGRNKTVSFLVEEAMWRPALLAALLDAVHAAMAAPDGPPVVLVVTDPRRGTQWIAALCHLMSPGTSRRLYWSTHERVSGLSRLPEKRIRLALLPADELDALSDTSGIVLVVDGDATVELGDLPHGQSHRTLPHDGEITVTPYSVVAAVVLQEPALAEAVLARQDEIAAEAGDRDLPCGWPLAVAVLEHADELGDVQPEARRLVEERPRAPLPRTLARRVRTLLMGSPGRTAADALDRAESLGEGSRSYDDAVLVYYQRAIEDRAWLLDDEPRRHRPLLALEVLDDDLVGLACAALDACTADGAAVPALRLIDFTLGIGLAEVEDGVARSLPGAITRSLDRLVGRLLLDAEQGPTLVAAAGPFAEGIQSGYLRPWVDAFLDDQADRAAGPPVGRRVPPDVLAWLYPEPPAPPGPALLADRDVRIPPTLAELAAQVTTVVPDPSAFRPLAARVLVETAGLDLRRRLTRLAKGPAFTTAELCALVEAHEALPVVPLLLPSLLGAPNDQALQATVARVLAPELLPHRHADDAVAAVLTAAELRRHTAAFDVGWAVSVRELLDAATPFAVPGPVLAPDVVDAVVAARVIEVVDGSAAPPERSSLVRWIFAYAAAGGVVSERVVDHLTRRLRGAYLVDVAVAAQLGSPDPRAVRGGRQAWAELGGLRVLAGDRAEPVLDHVVRRALHTMRHDEIVEFVRHVRATAARQLQVAEPNPAQDAFAEQWWQGVGAGDPGRAVFHRRGFR